VGSSVRFSSRLNEEGRSDRVIVDRFGTGDKWRNIAKRDFSGIVPVDGLFARLDRYGDAVEAVLHPGAIASTMANDAGALIANNLNCSIALWRWCTAASKPLI
jgi:ADP-L-glycero-D-manno-heptose 6-epimerase